MSTSKKLRKKRTSKKTLQQINVQVKQINVQVEQSNAQTDQSSIQMKQSCVLKEKILFVFEIITFIFPFVDIDGKPSILFSVVCFLALIILSTYGILVHYKHGKSTTTKSHAIHTWVWVLWVVLLICGLCVTFLSFANFMSWWTSKEHIPREVENDERQVLAQAELYYNGGLYESLVELYTSETLLENPIALNNLGYMYSKGIYFDQDFDTAVHYYELASNQGSSDAVHNLISIQLYSCATFEEVVNVLNKGYNSGDKGTFLFLGSILQGKELSGDPMTVQMRSNIVRDIESFFTANSETQANILSASFGPQQSGPAISSVVPQESESIYEQYILVGSKYVGSTYVYSYIKSSRTFRYDNLMQECFVSVIDSDL